MSSIPPPSDIGYTALAIYEDSLADPTDRYIVDTDDINGFPLLRLIDAFGRFLDAQDILVRDTLEGDPGWSLLFDLERVPDDAIAWLGQHIGVNTQGLGRTPAIDLIRNHPGFNRGTLAVITAAAQRWLTGTRTVTITERDTSPYHFNVRVIEAETGDLTYDELGALYPTYDAMKATGLTYAGLRGNAANLEADLLAAKPGALQMSLTITVGETYDELGVDFPTYDDMKATGLTYAQLHVRPPGP